MSNHHIIPKSRCKKLGIEKSNKKNIVTVPDLLHNTYHKFFTNMLPCEIINFLNSTFWGGQFEITVKRRKKL